MSWHFRISASAKCFRMPAKIIRLLALIEFLNIAHDCWNRLSCYNISHRSSTLQVSIELALLLCAPHSTGTLRFSPEVVGLSCKIFFWKEVARQRIFHSAKTSYYASWYNSFLTMPAWARLSLVDYCPVDNNGRSEAYSKRERKISKEKHCASFLCIPRRDRTVNKTISDHFLWKMYFAHSLLRWVEPKTPKILCCKQTNKQTNKNGIGIWKMFVPSPPVPLRLTLVTSTHEGSGSQAVLFLRHKKMTINSWEGVADMGMEEREDRRARV